MCLTIFYTRIITMVASYIEASDGNQTLKLAISVTLIVLTSVEFFLGFAFLAERTHFFKVMAVYLFILVLSVKT